MAKISDVVVVGAGHAGCEAALACARMGLETYLITTNLNEVAKPPCNPAVGGPGKTQLVREVDALGGEIAKNTDRAMINVRRLNTSKGPAMQVLRAQIDRNTYKQKMKKILENQDNLSLLEGLVVKLIWKNEKVTGVRTREGVSINTHTVVLTTGTFLDGKVYIGELCYPAGRAGEPPAKGLSKSLGEMGFELGRLNTCTTPRINKNTINVEELTRQDTNDEPLAFSYTSEKKVLSKDYPVWITYTTPETHRIIRKNLDRNPRHNGTLKGTAPRYCPSLETKVLKFPDRDRHKVFVEPEGTETEEMYLQGIYTSAPPDVQDLMVNSIPGLQNATIERYGYDIEYDFLHPIQLEKTLESKLIEGLYCAGQINGTTGYEEAAAQGIVAGINASLKIRGKGPIILTRDQAFIGVLIDDLVTKGVDEPYRMLTSRSEFRLILRANNADLRLTDIGHSIGLISDGSYKKFCRKRELIEKESHRLKNTSLNEISSVKAFMKRNNISNLDGGEKLLSLLKRPELSYQDLMALDLEKNGLPDEVKEEIEIQAKYEGYIKRQFEQVERFKRMEKKRIPKDLDYSEIDSLSCEGQERLEKIQPKTLGQASRIPGISRADISVLMIYLNK